MVDQSSDRDFFDNYLALAIRTSDLHLLAGVLADQSVLPTKRHLLDAAAVVITQPSFAAAEILESLAKALATREISTCLIRDDLRAVRDKLQIKRFRQEEKNEGLALKEAIDGIVRVEPLLPKRPKAMLYDFPGPTARP